VISSALARLPHLIAPAESSLVLTLFTPVDLIPLGRKQNFSTISWWATLSVFKAWAFLNYAHAYANYHRLPSLRTSIEGCSPSDTASHRRYGQSR